MTVRAAGALPWRVGDGGLQVALVHRPKYPDWSWPKGKLDAGESWTGAAVREVLEETGLRVALGLPLPDARYDTEVAAAVRPKLVRYWAAQVVGGDGALVNEVDQVAWLRPDAAAERLTHRRDRVQLDALAAAHAAGVLQTWPLVVARHATALPRPRWTGEDARRPLDGAGRRRAIDLMPVLSAYGVRRVVTSPAERCAATLTPFAAAGGIRVHLRGGLSEDGFATDPGLALQALQRLLGRAEPVAVCTHRPVLPALLGALADRCPDAGLAGALSESSGPGLVKGELLVAHVTGAGLQARVVAVERHDVL